MSFIKNIKDWFTDLLGAIVMGVTIYLIYTAQIQWMWEGIIGMCIGFVLLWVPDDIILKHIKKKVDKKLDD